MKKPRLFFDSDVLLDVILDRKPHFDDSQKALALAEQNHVEGFTSALIVANCYYILENIKDRSTALKAVRKLRSLLTILPLTAKEIDESLNSGFRDFEDGLQYFTAQNNSMDIILTRNTSDFKKTSLTVLSPTEFLNLEDVRKLIEND